MSFGCSCPVPQQKPTNYIKVFRGDDTNFNNSTWLKILLVTDIDLTGFQGVFNLLGFSYTGAINSEEKSLEIEIPASATSTFPIGQADGILRLEDTENRFKTVSNTIPFYITNEVFNQQEQNIILPVPPDYPISVKVQIPGTSAGGYVPPVPDGTTDYNELENLPTFNGTPWTGNQTYQSANIAPLSALNALEEVVDEKPSAVDVQNALNAVSAEIGTVKNDVGDLGDQVSNIEAKIPESASGTNMLVTKQEMDTAIAESGGGGDVDLSGYLPTTGGQMTGQIEFTQTNTDKNGLQFPGGIYFKLVGSKLETNQILNSTAWLTSSGYRVLTQGDIIPASQTSGLIPTTQKGAANGVAPLNTSGKIDSQYLPDLTPQVATVTSEKYGIQADYALTHGIVDCPNGIIDFSINNKEISIMPGLQIMLGGAETLTQVGSTLKYVVQGTGRMQLFLTRTESTGGTIQVGVVEVKKIFWQEAEPNYDGEGFAAWWSPIADKWYFLSLDAGNVWREAAAAGPFVTVNAGNTGITSANYYGFSINDGKSCASLSDIDSILEQMSIIMDRLDALENK